jgi:hypothetical protein
MKKTKFVTYWTVVTLIIVTSSVANAALWETYVIRNSSVGDIAPTISDVSDSKLFQITLGGQKAGWGTNLMNGMKVGDIQSVSITRDSSVSGWGPYMNIWITDGSGGYAVIANEPSHTAEWAPGTAYDTTWNILKNATVWVYENEPAAGFILPNGVTSYANNPVPAGTVSPSFTFDDFANYTIATPSTHWGGTGAPDDLLASSYTAYGFNWIFGDTQSNYLGGYLVSDPTLVPVPVPAAVILGILGMGVAGIKLRKYT